jgi:hypothetical protein
MKTTPGKENFPPRIEIPTHWLVTELELMEFEAGR